MDSNQCTGSHARARGLKERLSKDASPYKKIETRQPISTEQRRYHSIRILGFLGFSRPPQAPSYPWLSLGLLLIASGSFHPLPTQRNATLAALGAPSHDGQQAFAQNNTSPLVTAQSLTYYVRACHALTTATLRNTISAKYNHTCHDAWS